MGIGRRILEELMTNMTKMNVKDVFLYTSKENGTNQFYLKNGFIESDTMVLLYKPVN
jgi:N-acetylglutamate synthase-like GNAT family acetyltransferase